MPHDASVIGLLSETVPAWLAFPLRSGTMLQGYVVLPGSIWQRRTLDVTITGRGSAAAITETSSLRLPTWCPELHLYADRSFCLGYDKLPVRTIDEARQWWADVEIHLRLLSTAVRTRVWPSHSSLDHGDAGKFHRAARQLSRKLGLEDVYELAHAGESSWIADPDFIFVDRDGRPQDIRAPCPCGCRRRDGTAFERRRCPRQRDLAKLVLLDRARRLSLAEFWSNAREGGATCCGMLRDCPLAAPPNELNDPKLLAKTLEALKRTLI